MSLSDSEQIINFIQKSKRPLITFRQDFTIDGLASALALKDILHKLGKDKVDIVCWNFQVPKKLQFLPTVTSIKKELETNNQFIISLDTTKTKVDSISYNVKNDKLNFLINPKEGAFTKTDISTNNGGFKNDLIFILNTPDIESLGHLYEDNAEFFYGTPIINIDHKADNEHFGQINLVDTTATSASEIIGKFFYDHDQSLITENVATCLLTGMIAKTKSWQTPNTTPQALTLASNLVTVGARREDIMNNLYRSRSLQTLRLWGRVLARLKYEPNYKLVWSSLPREDFDKTKTSEEELTGVIDELISNAPEAKIIVLLYQDEQNKICALINTSKQLNAKMLVQNFQPEGSQSLAKIYLEEKDLKKAEEKILGEIKKIIDTITPA